MQFGDRLRYLREEKGITQEQLGIEVKVSGRVIGFYETNDRFPKEEAVLRGLADYFNISLDWLLGRIDTANSYTECNRSFTDLLRYNTVINNVKSKLACNGIIRMNEELSPEQLDIVVEHGMRSAIEILKLKK